MGEKRDMLAYKIATAGDIDLLMESRLEMLKEVNDLAENHCYDEAFVAESRRYFLEGNHKTVLVVDGKRVVACATLCYLHLMPTFDHPTGKRAHIMNVYTAKDHRRKGIGKRMMEMLIREAKEDGATEISLDATKAGRPLYRNCGFVDSQECMVL